MVARRSAGMPGPLSITLRRASSPRELNSSRSSSSPRRSPGAARPSGFMACTALMARFSSACFSSPASTRAITGMPGTSTRISTPALSACGWKKSASSCTMAPRSCGCGSSFMRPANCRKSLRMSFSRALSRASASTRRDTVARVSSGSSLSRISSRSSCALSVSVLNGFLISCASPLVMLPSSARRSAACARRSASIARAVRRRSARHVNSPTPSAPHRNPARMLGG